jgi:hypothetical protein
MTTYTYTTDTAASGTSLTFNLTGWGTSAARAIAPDPRDAALREARAAFRRLWLAFLLLACQFVVVAVAAVWGWAR